MGGGGLINILWWVVAKSNISFFISNIIMPVSQANWGKMTFTTGNFSHLIHALVWHEYWDSSMWSLRIVDYKVQMK